MKESYIPLPKLITLDTVDSTSDYLLRSLKGRSIDDVLVWALDQTKGRGVSGSWLSAKGESLTFSFSMRNLSFPAQSTFVLSALISNYLAAKISDIASLPVQVKWPNDIYTDSKKIAGILIEGKVSKGRITDLVVGIGININQKKFPAEVLSKATSIFLETGKINNLSDMAIFLISPIYLYARKNLYTVIPDEEIKRYNFNLYARGVKKRFRDIEKNEEFEGIILGVDILGKLKVQEVSSGRCYRYLSKQIQML